MIVRLPLMFVLMFLAVLPMDTFGAEPRKITEKSWSGEVVVEDELTLPKGSTLVIEPGTIVKFAGPYTLKVTGRLIAQGTEEAPIIFTSGKKEPAPGDWGGIRFERSAKEMNRLEYVIVRYATRGFFGTGSMVVIQESSFEENVVGGELFRDMRGGILKTSFNRNSVGLAFNQSGRFTVTHCEMRNNERFGIIMQSGSSPEISFSEITDNLEAGAVATQGSHPDITNSLLRGNKIGISLSLKAAPNILDNDIVDNDVGISGEKLVYPNVMRNRINGNRIGVYCNFSGYPRLHENDMEGNREFALALGDQQSVHVEKLIPFRDQGLDYKEIPKAGKGSYYPPKSKRFAPMPDFREGVVDARGNWWGAKETDELAGLDEGDDFSSVEDFFDKPETDYNGAKYPRDRAELSLWMAKKPKEVGRKPFMGARVEGKVAVGGEPAAGVRVHVFHSPEEGFKAEGFTFSHPTDSKGRFALNLGKGSYYLVAKRDGWGGLKPSGSGGEFSYYGGNPVSIDWGQNRSVNLQLVRIGEEKREKFDGGVENGLLEGVITARETGAEGAYLFAYTDSGKDFRGPDLFGPAGALFGGADDGGKFAVELPEGSYYLVATKRRDGASLGPIEPGDLHGFYPLNPVTVKTGEKVSIVLPMVEKLKEQDRSAVGQGPFTIRGVFRDRNGNPVEGAYGFASTDSMLMMGKMPKYRSLPSGKDGAFAIDLPEENTYYIGGRTGYGGPPMPGEWFGFHGGDLPAPVVIKKGGDLSSFELVLERME